MQQGVGSASLSFAATYLSLLALGTLGAGLTLLRKQKQHKSAIALTNDAQ